MAARAVTVSFLEHGLAILRMQRGENRINKEFVEAFHSCLDEVESNKECKGLITTAEGKFFSNGFDLQWLAGFVQQPDTISNFMTDFHKLTARILTFPLPTLAALNGHTFAGGAVLALAHDLRVMNNEKGWICLNEVFINLRLSPCHVKFIQSKLTPKAYHNMFAFGQRLTGPEAESAVVIDKAVPPSELEIESQKLLKAWIGKDGFPRESLQNMKKDIYEDSLKDLITSRLSLPK